MNSFLIYINGLLMPPDLFAVEAQNASNFGRFLQLTAKEEDVKGACEDIKRIRRIDVIEVRASSTVKRYGYEPSEDKENFVRLKVDDDNKDARVRFKALGVPNIF
jgi:hypothetical protein